jgi:hypothetical protein
MLIGGCDADAGAFMVGDAVPVSPIVLVGRGKI